MKRQAQLTTNNEKWLKDIFTGLRISLGFVLGLSMTGLLAVADEWG